MSNKEFIPFYRGLVLGEKKRRGTQPERAEKKKNKKNTVVVSSSEIEEELHTPSSSEGGSQRREEAQRESREEESRGGSEGGTRRNEEEEQSPHEIDNVQPTGGDERVPPVITQIGSGSFMPPGGSSQTGTTVPPIIHPYDLEEAESNEETDTDSISGSTDLSDPGQGRLRPWKPIKGKAPWTREEPWVVRDGEEEREMSLVEKIDNAKDMNEFSEVFYNDIASRKFNGFSTEASWERFLRHMVRVLTTMSLKASAFITKAQEERSSVSEAQTAIENLTQEVNGTKHQLKEKELALSVLQAQHVELMGKYQAHERKIELFRKTVQECQVKTRSSLEERDAEREKVGALETEKESLTKTLAETRIQLEAAKKEKQDLVQENQGLKQDLENSRKDAQEWEANYRSLEETNNVLEAENERVEAAKTEIEESLSKEKAEHLAKFLGSPAFSKVALFSQKPEILQLVYQTVENIGKIKGFKPEDFGLTNPTEGVIDVSSGVWEPETNEFLFEGSRLPHPGFSELKIKDPGASGSGSK